MSLRNVLKTVFPGYRSMNDGLWNTQRGLVLPENNIYHSGESPQINFSSTLKNRPAHIYHDQKVKVLH